jgi:transcriptional regulator with XRE-family HTH domain
MQEPISFSEDELLIMYRAVGKNVKKYREQKGMSQLQLSHAMGYNSVSLVSAAELTNDGKHFNLEHLYKISKILNIKLSTLVKLD